MADAFDSYDLAGTALANRIAMAPMTRSRAYGPGATATELMATYYAQRAGAGLIITEGTQPSPAGQGYTSTPGLHTAEQVQAWRTVTDAVHAAGGVIFAQLMHTGRIGHPRVLPDGLHPVGPSAVKPAGKLYTADGLQEFETPRELTEPQIAATIADFATAARNAIAAGFDGAEIHGANGYLVHQFLAANANRRTDGWGATVEGRIRFGVEVAAAVAAAIGGHRTGFRISPANPYNDITEDGTDELYAALLAGLAPLGLAYLHLVESPDRALTRRLRAAWPGTFVLNPATYPGITGPDALALIADGTADLVSFGALFLANPDLPARLAAGGPYNTPDKPSFFGGDHRGYTDYPTLAG
ncbi:alkene reductase [Actinoplanes derwentensis]|uniref:N-ethylmaleimide reductase n=1 Tax=Actinoplanes derwentensis TaxID=113562 RepID=A0A1H1WWS1_9ACTN|nr:alkene reductase [Actinoplanes derwentensis]GID90499.1 alkene reductase [Actinoplanes derwentensis]SDT01648.1 N-ethylmaleimide reductase [Actinoplanes derwentensis]